MFKQSCTSIVCSAKELPTGNVCCEMKECKNNSIPKKCFDVTINFQYFQQTFEKRNGNEYAELSRRYSVHVKKSRSIQGPLQKKNNWFYLIHPSNRLYNTGIANYDPPVNIDKVNIIIMSQVKQYLLSQQPGECSHQAQSRKIRQIQSISIHPAHKSFYFTFFQFSTFQCYTFQKSTHYNYSLQLPTFFIIHNVYIT